MTALDTRVVDILNDPLAPARAAGQAIGFVGLEMPDDLLAASGRFAIHLPWSVDRATPRADEWLESAFPGAARSILEDWAEGHFDFLEAVLFTRGEDSSQRLYYYVSELQRQGELKGPEPLIFDVAKVPRTSSVERTRTSLVHLAERLDANEEKLRSGIVATNRQRLFFADLAAARAGAGSRYERIARAALFDRIESFDTGPAPGELAGPRLLLAGSAPPDDRIHRSVEAAGANVVAELYDRSLERLGLPLDLDGDPFLSLAQHAHEARLGARSFVDRSEWLVEQARSAEVDGVVLWLVAEEEALVWHVPAQQRALAEANIPTLVLTNRRVDASDGVVEEIEAFVAGLKR